MAVVLVDYENVFENGLAGIDLLKNTDTLEIFYSESCKNIRRECLDIINNTGCSFKTCKLLNKGKDYLDKYIAVATGEYYKSGEKEICIISKDKGYKAIIDYYRVTGIDDIRVIKAENIEQAFLSLSNPADHDRRFVIHKRLKQVSLDEISIRLKEKESIKTRIKEALINTPYWFMTEEICDFVEESKGTNNRMLYTGALHNFGRENGRAVYNIIKEVV